MSMRYTGKWDMSKAAFRRYGSGTSMVSQIMERKKVQRKKNLREDFKCFTEYLRSIEPVAHQPEKLEALGVK